LGKPEIEAFLTHLAIRRNVSAKTQNQAFSAILFLYKHVLKLEFPAINALRAKQSRRLPVVLSQQEVARLIENVEGGGGSYRLMVELTYGAGLRLLECCRLRVKDVDFDRRQLTVREGKGDKDRVTTMPRAVVKHLQEHLQRVRTIHQQDVADGYGRVELPHALARKYPKANQERCWQFVIPLVAPPAKHFDRRAGPSSHRRMSVFAVAVRFGAQGWPHEASHQSHVSPFVRDTPAGGRLRH
jgi:integrase